tara:strand:+ start:339 stop:599 length:261 start_codon:yes stop_codon:yes gene_type:complete
MQYFVYILISLKTNRPTTYVGYTNNLKKRLQLHNQSKGAKYTKGKLWKIIYKKKYKTKSEAMKNEYKLKKDRRKRSLIKLKYLSKL